MTALGTSLGTTLAAALLLAPSGAAQVYSNAPGNIPQGAPFNNSVSAQVDFADVDLDGDWDAGLADGGDSGPDQNRLWINLGGLQGGAVGFFADETAARLPQLLDPSRDLEFADLDSDGDSDLHIVETSDFSSQASRWWINSGGLQAGTAGFFVDETAARWVGLGGPGSSVPPALVLAGGGYIHWGEEHAFADLDADGDLDLIAAAVGGTFGGQEPTRVFLNDGAGFFSEFNPSGFQLTGPTIAPGSPGLWCQGFQQSGTSNTSGAFCDIAAQGLAVDAADLEGDFDLDFVLLDRSSAPRVFRNLSELGSLALRDVTGLTWPAGWGSSTGKYEQDFGDLDGDQDLDLYGVNWVTPFHDATLANAGDGTFTVLATAPGTSADGDDGDLVDFDSDGDLDVFLAAFGGSDVLLRNDTASGPILLDPVPGAVLGGPFPPANDVDAADVDFDGDYDLIQTGYGLNSLLLNILDVADASAPTLPALEHPADHMAAGAPTVLRAHVLDNTPDYLTAYNATELLYSVDGAPFVSVPMRWSGAQVFRGEIPSSALGNVRFRVRSADAYGNTGLSALKSVHTDGGCSGSVSTYCTAKLTSEGCTPAFNFLGAPSASAGSGFTVRVGSLVAGVNGLFFYSKSGPAGLPFQGGTLCVAAPLVRTPIQSTGGSGACGGALLLDFNAWIASGADPALAAGAQVWIQAWSRDPASPSTTSVSDALSFEICP